MMEKAIRRIQPMTCKFDPSRMVSSGAAHRDSIGAGGNMCTHMRGLEAGAGYAPRCPGISSEGTRDE